MAKSKKYSKLLFTGFKEPSNLPGVLDPQAYFRGDMQIPGAGMNMGWQVFSKPIHLEKEAHIHDADEYLIFLGAELPDLFSSFDAEIDLWMGEEMEKCVITKPTIVYVPKNFSHTPLNFRKLNKPVLFSALLLAPRFTKKMGSRLWAYDGPNNPLPKNFFKSD
ncbi:MAG TPA: hypothetical protein VLH15_11605 [Dehalococcoidales bacterium]|nr:hypothetical protein [Dehalococcoidales bacterium]